MREEFLTVEDVQRELRCGRAKVFELFAAGALPSFRLGRRRLVRRSDLEALAARLVGADRELQGVR